MGWQYWRAETVEGHAPELSTDADSKMAKYRRLVVACFVCLLPSAIFFASPTMRNTLSTLSSLFVMLIMAILAVNIVGLVPLVARLTRPAR